MRRPRGGLSHGLPRRNIRAASSYSKSSAYRPQPMTARKVRSASRRIRWSSSSDSNRTRGARWPSRSSRTRRICAASGTNLRRCSLKQPLALFRPAAGEHASGRGKLQTAVAELGEFEDVKRFGDREEVIDFQRERGGDRSPSSALPAIGRGSQGLEQPADLVDRSARQRLGEAAVKLALRLDRGDRPRGQDRIDLVDDGAERRRRAGCADAAAAPGSPRRSARDWRRAPGSGRTSDRFLDVVRHQQHRLAWAADARSRDRGSRCAASRP